MIAAAALAVAQWFGGSRLRAPVWTDEEIAEKIDPASKKAY